MCISCDSFVVVFWDIGRTVLPKLCEVQRRYIKELQQANQMGCILNLL